MLILLPNVRVEPTTAVARSDYIRKLGDGAVLAKFEAPAGDVTAATEPGPAFKSLKSRL